MNFAFYISGKSGRLFKFLKQIDKNTIGEIKIVISDYALEERLAELIKACGIESVIYDYKDLCSETIMKKNRELSDKMLACLKKYKIDYCFSFGSHILSGDLLQEYKNKLINFHPAILPMYPGRNAIDQAVDQGNTFLIGNTAHFIDSGIDTGIVIMQSVIPLQAFFPEHDYDAILDLQIEMLIKLISILKGNRLELRNNRCLIKDADYSVHHIYPEIAIFENIPPLDNIVVDNTGKGGG